jgi:hypothetical protein
MSDGIKSLPLFRYRQTHRATQEPAFPIHIVLPYGMSQADRTGIAGNRPSQ